MIERRPKWPPILGVTPQQVNHVARVARQCANAVQSFNFTWRKVCAELQFGTPASR